MNYYSHAVAHKPLHPSLTCSLDLFIYLFIFTSVAPGMQIRGSKSVAALKIPASLTGGSKRLLFLTSFLFACDAATRKPPIPPPPFRARQRRRCNHTPIESGPFISGPPFHRRTFQDEREKERKKRKAGGGGGGAGGWRERWSEVDEEEGSRWKRVKCSSARAAPSASSSAGLGCESGPMMKMKSVPC